MLPLWRDRLHIALRPDRLILLRRRRGFAGPIVEKTITPCPQQGHHAPWTHALEALRSALSMPKWQDCDATVLLSNHFVRHILVPWNDQLSNEAEQNAFLRHSFTKVYGDAVEQWVLRMSDDSAGNPRLASAVDQNLLDELEALVENSPLRLRSIQPYFMAAFNQWRGQLKGQSLWFALAEADRLCLAFFRQGRWTSMRMRPLRGSLAGELTQILEQEAYTVGAETEQSQLYLYAPEQADFLLPTGSPWQLTQLKLPARVGFSPFTDAAYAMAMSGDV